MTKLEIADSFLIVLFRFCCLLQSKKSCCLIQVKCILVYMWSIFLKMHIVLDTLAVPKLILKIRAWLILKL